MLINLRDALMAGKRLPYDAEVEFLESTGTQYVNTGILASAALNDAQIDITYSSSSTSGDLYIFGGGNTFNTAIQCVINSTSKYFQPSWGQSLSIPDGYAANAVTTLRMTYDDYVLAFNTKTKTGSFTATSRTFNDRAIYLFRGNRTSGGINTKPVRIYAFKISRNGVAILDLIPVRKGTVGYLYDRVSGKLFGNAGTGDFVLGQDVVPVEYIESHGTEYIDTGFNITNATSFSYDAKFSLASTITKSEPRVFSNEGAGSGAYYDIYFSTAASSLMIRQAVTAGVQISRRDVPIIATMDEHGVYRGYYEDTPQTPLYEATRAFVAPTTDRDYRIFSRGNNTGTNYLWQGKLYRLDFTKNGEPSRRYRPVRVGTEGAMMDTLTRRIYRNAGTGAFGYGNDLPYPIPAQ